MIKHFVVTRLGLSVYDEQRLGKMIDLFEAVTMSSLSSQSSQEFVWLVIVDADIPSNVRAKIEQSLSCHPNAHLLPIDLTSLLHVRIGCFDWVWDHCQDYILETGLLENPHDFVITSIIDADDAWHQNVISTVNGFLADRLRYLGDMEEARGTWLRHSSGMAVTFRHGYRWFISANTIEPMDCEFNSMGVFVIARLSSGISACSSRHRRWPSYANVLDFPVTAIETGDPMWLYCRHDETVTAWEVSAVTPIDTAREDQLGTDFGINTEKIRRWRSTYRPAPGTSNHSGRSAAVQFDRLFQIAGLNRKIRALKKRERLDDPSSALVIEEIDRCEVERALLIATLRRN